MLIKRKRIKLGIKFIRNNQNVDPCIGCDWYNRIGKNYSCDIYKVADGRTIGNICTEIYSYYNDGKYAYFPEYFEKK